MLYDLEPDAETRSLDAMMAMDGIVELLEGQNSEVHLSPEPLAALMRLVSRSLRGALPHVSGSLGSIANDDDDDG